MMGKKRVIHIERHVIVTSTVRTEPARPHEDEAGMEIQKSGNGSAKRISTWCFS